MFQPLLGYRQGGTYKGTQTQ